MDEKNKMEKKDVSITIMAHFSRLTDSFVLNYEYMTRLWLA